MDLTNTIIIIAIYFIIVFMHNTFFYELIGPNIIYTLQDYGIDFDDITHPIEAFRCSCGSPNCRDKDSIRLVLKSLTLVV